MKSMKLRLTSLEKEKCTLVNSLKSTEKSSNKLNLKEKGLLLKKNNLSNKLEKLKLTKSNLFRK
jgi:hypothetical protein